MTNEDLRTFICFNIRHLWILYQNMKISKSRYCPLNYCRAQFMMYSTGNISECTRTAFVLTKIMYRSIPKELAAAA